MCLASGRKKSGYARLDGAGEQHLLLADQSVTRLAKAKDADTFAYVAETFESSPAAYTAASDLKNGKAVIAANPFQADYAWARSELIEYKNSAGQRLQGALYYPAGYEAGKKYR